MILKQVLFLVFLLPLVLFGQQTGVIFGKISDPDGKPVFNANIAISDHAGGTTTNKDGSYELRIPANKKVLISISFIGYEISPFEITVKSGERTEVNKILKASSTQLESVEVKDQQIRKSTFNRLDPKSATFIPSMNSGIEDLIKTMPGVASRNELSSQYSVRGGNQSHRRERENFWSRVMGLVGVLLFRARWHIGKQ